LLLFLPKFAQWKQCSAILRFDILLLVDVDVAMVKANSQVVTRGRKWVIWATQTGDFSSRFKEGRLPSHYLLSNMNLVCLWLKVQVMEHRKANSVGLSSISGITLSFSFISLKLIMPSIHVGG